MAAPERDLHEECGVAGVWLPQDAEVNANELAIAMLGDIQHRGQDGSGGIDNVGQSYHREGAIPEELPETMNSHATMAVFHNRYRTTGSTNDDRNIQPRPLHRGALGHNGTLIDVMESLVTQHAPEIVIDSEMSDTVIATEALQSVMYANPDMSVADGLKVLAPDMRGAYSMIAMDTERHELIGFVDKFGMRPLSWGYLPDGGVAIDSETYALEQRGVTETFDVQPGQMIRVNESGVYLEQVLEADPKACVFELIYFMRPESKFRGELVRDIRYRLGHTTAREMQAAGFEIPEDAVITSLPASADPAAEGFAAAYGREIQPAIVKKPNANRSFIEPEENRTKTVDQKFIFDEELIKDKHLYVVDDSVVRGKTGERVAARLFELGAASVTFISASPQILDVCHYGVNIDNESELVAPGRSNAQIAERFGIDAMFYLSMEGMVASIPGEKDSYCTGCLDREYPPEQPVSITRRAVEVQLVD